MAARKSPPKKSPFSLHVRNRRKKLLQRYGLTQEDYDDLLTSQKGGCAVCGSTDPRSRTAKHLFVDHCHFTGKVRGLLCHHCNSGIGKLGDNPTLLRAAADYIERNRQ